MYKLSPRSYKTKQSCHSQLCGTPSSGTRASSLDTGSHSSVCFDNWVGKQDIQPYLQKDHLTSRSSEACSLTWIKAEDGICRSSTTSGELSPRVPAVGPPRLSQGTTYFPSHHRLLHISRKHQFTSQEQVSSWARNVLWDGIQPPPAFIVLQTCTGVRFQDLKGKFQDSVSMK